MHSTRIHKVIVQIISFVRFIGLWHGEDRPTVTQLRLKSIYCIYHLLFPISFLIGAITKETVDESIFLTEIFIAGTVMTIKIWMILWKQQQLVRLLNRICIFSIRNDDEFSFFNVKMERFIKFVIAFACSTFVCTLGNASFPFIANEKVLILDIAFPLDYKHSRIGFCLAYIFFVTEMVVTLLAMAFTVIIWYLLLHCSLRYKILGMEIRNMGRVRGNVKILRKEQKTICLQDLLGSIEAHIHLTEIINELESFLSKLFLLQFATSALCICGSIYCLAFDVSVNFMERLVHVYTLFYHIAELFMITYFGNEIMLSSSWLTYSLFESDWVEQPHSTKKCIIIFGEYLKQPYEMLIGKLYPLTLGTFTRIVNKSYSLFNILKNNKQ